MAGLSTRTHGFIDYAVGFGLIAAADLLDFREDTRARSFTRSMGVVAVAYSLCTDYELGAFKLVPVPVHLRVDAGWASALALGPWMFGFARRGKRYWIPHAMVALASAVVVAATERGDHGGEK